MVMFMPDLAQPEVEVAHVLYMDLVEFSRLPMQEQTRLISRLQQLLRDQADFQRADAAGDLIRLPTGDGIALVFFRNPEAPVRCALDVARAARAIPQMRLRMGLHSGPVHRIADINTHANVAGSGINLAQRVMAAGDPGHILLSDTIAQMLHQMGDWSEYLRDLGDFEVKHGQHLHLFNLCRDGAGHLHPPARISAAEREQAGALKVVILYKRHAFPDEALMQRIEELLVENGHHVFVDRHLTIGVDWAEEIERQITSADAVIPLLSETSARSETVAHEIATAARARTRSGKPRLLPVRIGSESPLPPALAPFLDRVEFASWQGAGDDERLFAKLLNALTQIPKIKEPPPSSPLRRRRSLGVGLAVMTVVLGLIALRTGDVSSWLRVLVNAEPKQLAVLPFKNIGDVASNQAFSDGLSETITSQLTQLERFQRTLLVIPMSEVRKETVVTAKAARTAFGATLALTGSVQREADTVRVTVSLIDTKSLRILRSMTLDHSPTESYLLQDRVAAETASWLGLELSADVKRVLAAGQTRMASAYDLYVQGRGKLARRDLAGNLDGAIGHLQQALSRDPRYALAHAALGEAFWFKYVETRDASWVEEARRSCLAALESGSTLAEPHITLAVILNGTGEYPRAITEAQTALRIDPVNTEATRELARAYDRLNRPAEAEEAFKRAIERNPLNGAAYHQLAVFYWRAGRNAEAEKNLLRVAELMPDNYAVYRNLGGLYVMMGRPVEAARHLEKSLKLKPSATTYSNLGTLRFQQERYQEAAALFEQAVELNPRDYLMLGNYADSLRFLPGRAGDATAAYERAIRLATEALQVNAKDHAVQASLARYYVFSGDPARALQAIEQARSLAPLDLPVAFNAAVVFEHCGRRDQAWEALAMAIKGGYSPADIARNPDIKNLRTDTRFAALMTPPPPDRKK